MRTFVMSATLYLAVELELFLRKFLLVCDIFELWILCILFFCVLAQKGRILRATGRILRVTYPESPDLYPEFPGPADRYTFY